MIMILKSHQANDLPSFPHDLKVLTENLDQNMIYFYYDFLEKHDYHKYHDNHDYHDTINS